MQALAQELKGLEASRKIPSDIPVSRLLTTNDHVTTETNNHVTSHHQLRHPQEDTDIETFICVERKSSLDDAVNEVNGGWCVRVVFMLCFHVWVCVCMRALAHRCVIMKLLQASLELNICTTNGEHLSMCSS